MKWMHKIGFGGKASFLILLSLFFFSCRLGVDEPDDNNNTGNLPVPTNLSLEYDSLAGWVTLNWESGGGEVLGFFVFRDTAQGAGPTPLLEEDEFASPPFIDFELPDLQGDTLRLYYKVQAGGLEGNVSGMVSFPVLIITNGSGGGVNHPPVFSPINDTTISEGQYLSIPLSASDPDGDAVTYTLSGAPEGASITGSTFTWTPTDQQSGAYVISITATDVGSPPLSVTEQFVLTVEDEATLADQVLGRWDMDSVYISAAVYDGGVLLDSSKENVYPAGENYFDFSANNSLVAHFSDPDLGGPLTETLAWWVQGNRIAMEDAAADTAFFEVEIQGNGASFTTFVDETNGTLRVTGSLIYYATKN